MYLALSAVEGVGVPLAPGTNLGPYEIQSPAGAGGMGEVYRARDTRLGREVALKLLSAKLVSEEISVKRFQREARTASALNHPHICTVYDVGEHNGAHYIAMELMEGQTLADTLAAGPLPIEDVLRLGIQIADALDAAHHKGVIHRDIKPSNIFVTSREEAKLLDFGLAKEPYVTEQARMDAPTLSGPMTSHGEVLGTIGYMSPEQAEGKEVDARSDIFSFGAVLYEMATGQRAFRGTSGASVFAEILRGQPIPVPALNPNAPEELQRVISKALEKRPSDRYQSARELMIDLKRLNRQISEVPTTATGRRPRLRGWRSKAVPVLAIAAMAALVFALIALLAPARNPGPLNSAQVTFGPERKTAPLMSDGSRLYFQSEGKQVEMSAKGGPIVPIRSSVSDMTMLDVSPDASEMLTLKPDPNDETGRGSIWRVPLMGGAPRRIGMQMARAARWSPDGRSILYCDMNSVYASGADGSTVRKIWDAPGRVMSGAFSPDSRLIRVTVVQNHQARIWEVHGDGTGAHGLDVGRPNDENQFDGQWSADGKHFFFSSRRGAEPTNIYELVVPRWFEFWKKATAVRLTSGELDILATTPKRDNSGLLLIGRVAQGAMHAYDPKQKRFVPFLNGLAAQEFVISPDKQWMVYTDYPRHYLWRSRLDGSEKLQLTTSYAMMPRWSPDGRTIVYSDWRKLYLVSTDGGAPERLLPPGKNDAEVGQSWWPDGKAIAFNDFPYPEEKIMGIKVLDLATRQVSLMPGSEGFFVPSWSPDGRYMVAIARDPLRMMLYSAGSKTWKQIMRFDAPWGYWVWLPDSKRIFMSAADGIYRIAIPDGKMQRVASLDGLDISEQELFLSLTPDGQPALMSDTSAVQIYSLQWNN